MTKIYRKFFLALEEYTGEITVKDQERPILINLNGEDVSVYIGNLGRVTREPNNVRHAPSKKNIGIQRDRHKSGIKVAFIGMFDGGNNYCAWNPQNIFSLKTVTQSSLRAPRMYEKKNLDRPIVESNNKHPLVIMPSSALGPYLENVEALYSLNEDRKIIEALEYGMRSLPESVSRYKYTEPGKQVELKFRRTLIKPRDENFRIDVMHAYCKACCVCGLQFATEAAHIVPHKDERTSQAVRNGLALCPNHHRMYDSHLFQVTPEYKISINHEKLKELRKEGLIGGLDDIMKLEGKRISLPRDKEAWPSKEYLGLRSDMGTDS